MTTQPHPAYPTAPTAHLAETIDGILEFARMHETPAAYARLCRKVAGSASLRLDNVLCARRWARMATRNLIAAHRARPAAAELNRRGAETQSPA